MRGGQGGDNELGGRGEVPAHVLEWWAGGQSVGGCCLCREIEPHPLAGWPWARPCLHLAALLVDKGAMSSFPGLSSEPLSIQVEREYSSLIAGLGVCTFQAPKVEASRTIRCNIY